MQILKMKKFLCLVLAFALCMSVCFAFGCDTSEGSERVVFEYDGKVAVTENGIDFSEVTVLAQRNSSFEKDEEYTIAVFLGTVELLSAFDAVNYTEADMSFKGKSVTVPALEVGEYALSTYFALKTVSGYTIMEPVTLTIQAFTAFDKKIDYAEGHYIYAFSQADDALKITVTSYPAETDADTDNNGGNGNSESVELPALPI